MFGNRFERESAAQALIMDQHSGRQRRPEEDYLEPKRSVHMKHDWHPPPGAPPVHSPDSGVDMKDGVQFDDLSASWKKPKFNQPQSFDHRYRPDSVAVEGHEYEQLPGLRKQYTMYADIPDDSPMSHAPKLPTPPNSRSASMTDVGTIKKSEKPVEQRRRENPLYDSMPEYKSMNSLRSDYPPSQSSRCLCVAVILAFLFAVGALALGIVVIVMLKTPSSTNTGPSTGASTGGDPLVQELRDKISELEKKIQNMESGQSQGTGGAIEGNVDRNTVQIEELVRNITAQQSSIEKLQKNGASGAGNLSRCKMEKKERGNGKTGPPVDTPWIYEDQDWKMMGVECSTTGGLYAIADQNTNSNGYNGFRCTCWGVDDNASTKHCYLYVWLCPTVS